MTSYSPSDPADVTKSRFVDKSHALGVSLQNGSLSSVTGTSLTVGKGGAPFLALSASSSPTTRRRKPAEAPVRRSPRSPPAAGSTAGRTTWRCRAAGSRRWARAIRARRRARSWPLWRRRTSSPTMRPRRSATRPRCLPRRGGRIRCRGNVATVSLGTSSHQFARLRTAPGSRPAAARPRSWCRPTRAFPTSTNAA